MASRTSPVVLQAANVLAIFATILVNLLANILPLNGVFTGKVSDSYPNLFTPSGYVFTIWGVIYVLLVTFMIYQARANQRGQGYLAQIGFLHLLAAIANITWLVLFHYSYGVPSLFLLSILPMTVLLLSLLMMYVRLGVGIREVPLKQRLAVHLPVSVYLGWISVAIIANIASALNVLVPGIPLPTQEVWTAVVIVVALVISLLMIMKRSDIAFGLVFVWAVVGVAVKQMASLVILTTAVTAALAVVVSLFALILLRRRRAAKT
ncbi:MAG: hypothetical protein C4K49_12720 [Candidatus Thorarchaeota archaeon]|nr:MAG: hypothetical protein C4K49_12720 [Candidatus Thorarchaeota archaeon]